MRAPRTLWASPKKTLEELDSYLHTAWLYGAELPRLDLEVTGDGPCWVKPRRFTIVYYQLEPRRS